jgi:hypothetical protein
VTFLLFTLGGQMGAFFEDLHRTVPTDRSLDELLPLVFEVTGRHGVEFIGGPAKATEQTGWRLRDCRGVILGIPRHRRVMLDSREVVSMTSGIEIAGDERPRRRTRASLKELAAAKGVRPVQSVEEMAVDGIFESDEELDEFLRQVRAWRQADLA